MVWAATFDHEAEATCQGWWSNKIEVWNPLLLKPPYQLWMARFQTLLPKTIKFQFTETLMLWVFCHSWLNLLDISSSLLVFPSLQLQWASAHLSLAPGLCNPFLLSGFTSRVTQELYSSIHSLIYFKFWYLLQDPSYCSSETVRSLLHPESQPIRL